MRKTLKVERKHLGYNEETGNRQELLDMELKYERVCIMYHSDIGNHEKWYGGYAALDLLRKWAHIYAKHENAPKLA